MEREQFQESLLQVMENKQHWAWPGFATGLVPKNWLHVHFEQEYAVYVRDFPVLVARAYVQCPIASVRRELAENVYEEETGGLVAGRPHPELFLDYPKGLGFDVTRFDRVTLLPKAAQYRKLLDALTINAGWEVAAAVTTIFIEGTPFDRGELDPAAAKRPESPLEQHPLVVHYNLPLSALSLTKAHRRVEGSHRQAAWRCVLDFVETAQRQSVVSAMQKTLEAWKEYRNDVATACGLKQGPDGRVMLLHTTAENSTVNNSATEH